jgi:hypothetical protein
MTSENDSIGERTSPTNYRRASTANRSDAGSKPSNSAAMMKLLSRAKGATPTELMASTGWQAHSIRAFLSGLRKKGRLVVREARKSGEFCYRIEVTPAVKSRGVTSAAEASTASD